MRGKNCGRREREMWRGVLELIAEIKRCENMGATIPAITVAYVCIDTMAFLSMPATQTSQTRKDFIAWADAYLKGDLGQPYQYAGIDVYAARCAVLHAFGAESELHQRNCTIKKFGYHDGGSHILEPSVSPNLVIIGVRSFLNDIVIAVESFMSSCEGNAVLRGLVEARLPKVFQSLPFPHD
jgi:hypothetical protein